jgi:hypothetical protein
VSCERDGTGEARGDNMEKSMLESWTSKCILPDW